MDALNLINGIVVVLGLPTIIGASIYIGKKLQILNDLQSDMNKVKQNLHIVCNFLIKNNDNFNSSELKALSPFELTDIGRNFIKEINFDKIFEENKDKFFSFIKNENPKLKYDVEISAIKAISALYNENYMQFLKIYFYNNPLRNLENTAPTLGVYIRDAYLREHPEINQ